MEGDSHVQRKLNPNQLKEFTEAKKSHTDEIQKIRK